MEPLADKIGKADALVTIDRGEPAPFAIEGVSAPSVDLVIAQARAYLVVEDLDELQVAVDGGMCSLLPGW